ncbi:MAG: hypothetical protein GWN16_08595, partial [Calditrichae bacterium]|nr:hypothetical protein [Calditrichia bacterium]NIV72247.1 hypothetical protein [Calditrichia bacterium]NIW79495.1 hypothetical protein [Calditrichia bacterium]
FVSGDQGYIDRFTQIANDKLGGLYTVSVAENGLVTIAATGEGPLSRSQQAFLDVLNGAASFDVGAVRIGLVSGDSEVDVGSYLSGNVDGQAVSGLIDIADIAAFPA